MSVMANEFPVVSGQAEEPSYFLIRCRTWPLHDCFDLGRLGMQTRAVDVETTKIDLPSGPLALIFFDPQSGRR